MKSCWGEMSESFPYFVDNFFGYIFFLRPCVTDEFVAINLLE